MLAFAAGVIVATRGNQDVQRLVTSYVRAWTSGNFARMYGLLDERSRLELPESQFVSEYQAAAQTATLQSLRLVRQQAEHASVVPVRMLVHTVAFGTLHETLLVPIDDRGASAAISFSGSLLFPGLRAGESLHRTVTLPPRAAILARDGTPLAQGPDRTSPIPTTAAGIVGTLGPIPSDQRTAYAALGYPPDTKVGLDGLERVFQQQLAGTAGGTLYAGSRVLAARAPHAGPPVRTTIDPSIELATINALGARFGGIAAMDPRTGAILGLAGLAFSVVQPPGSTMKIITVSAALQAHLVKPTDVFPYGTSATINGYTLQNANGEDCGGSLVLAFAVSCNSVFAPLGARVGGKRLVAMAERYGFNQPVGIPGAAESQIPSASTIGDALAVASSAIGQGRVEASALEMTDVAATVAMGGRRPIPTLQAGQRPRFVHVTSPHVAREVQHMMIEVVNEGTGTAAAIPGVTVAGKTGTAELANTSTTQNKNNPSAQSPKNTDAWFVGYAPVGAPRIVAGGLFPNQGAGGATAAPAIREVLIAGLQAH